MLRLSANLSTIFCELPFGARFDAARRAGFAAVEMQYPYANGIAEAATAARDAGLPVVLINAPKGAQPRDRGLACLPGREVEFRDTIMQALDASAMLKNELIHVLSGVPEDGMDRDACLASWLANMHWAAAQAAPSGVEIVIEALNPTDVPGYFIRSLDDAATLLNLLNEANVGLLFDSYHCAMAGEPVTEQFKRNRHLVRHIQIADAPGRAEPGTGDTNWDDVFSAIRQSGWKHYVGVEYTPRNGTLAGLGWARPYLETCMNIAAP